MWSITCAISAILWRPITKFLEVGCIMSSLFQSLRLLSCVLYLSIFIGLILCLWLDHLFLVLPGTCFLGLCLGLGGAEMLLVCFCFERPRFSYIGREKGSWSYSRVKTPWIQPYGLSCRCRYLNCPHCQFYIHCVCQ